MKFMVLSNEKRGVSARVERINTERAAQEEIGRVEGAAPSAQGSGAERGGGGGVEGEFGAVERRRKTAKPDPPINGHSERSACITSMRAARAAGSQDATTAAASSTNAERITGKAPGIFTSKK